MCGRRVKVFSIQEKEYVRKKGQGFHDPGKRRKEKGELT
jgi:hypothetical protein